MIHPFKTWVAAIWVAFLFASCQMNSQTKSLRAFEKCQYEIYSADSIFLANRDVMSLLKKDQFEIQDLGNVALSFLTGEIPLAANLKVKIKNPTRNQAAINQFQYKISIEEKLVAEGTSDLPVRVPAQDEAIVPVALKANIFPIFQDQALLNQLLGFMNKDESLKITIAIKPTLTIGNKAINYPGYISINKIIKKSQIGLLN